MSETKKQSLDKYEDFSKYINPPIEDDEKIVDYNGAIAILNGEVECSPEDYDLAVAEAIKCIKLLVDTAKLVNDASRMSSLTVEKIRKTLNKELKGSNENYIFQW